MWRGLALLLLCFTVSGLEVLDPSKDGPPAPEGQHLSSTRDAALETGAQQPGPDPEPLEDEMDNQENIISQLLGDYDKVKTESSGSDCVCRCIVRPIKRSDCSKVPDGDTTSPSQEFYTVETITKGTDCKKCVCMAPSSAVNPCEGEYRFKRLQEASKDDIKLATIMDLLEGSLYGLDLLKLQSVTTKLLTRMDNMEKAFTRNLTEIAREKEYMKGRAKEKEKEKKPQQKKKKVTDLTGQKSQPAINNKQKNYEDLKKNQQQDGLEQQPTRNKTATQKSIKENIETKKPIKEKNIVVVKGMTFYKAEEESYQEDERRRSTQSSLDRLIFDHLPPARTLPIQSPGPVPTVSTEPDHKDLSKRLNNAASTQQPTDHTTRTTAKPTEMMTNTQQTMTTTRRSASNETIVRPTDASPVTESQPGPRSRLSWTESPADQPKTTKKPGVCKDTVASLSDPVQHNTYGPRDGAWMRDARGHGSVIYLTSGHYGDEIVEFRDMDSFKSGQVSNTYKLPYSFTGTGHVVFNGAFYYNRAFSRDVIRYDLRHRFVAAWTTLHDALLEEQAHQTQTEVEFAVDESGLWLLYPALDTEGFRQEVILLTHVRSSDLQPMRTFRTGLHRGRHGNSFLVCGVLYAVDSIERQNANVTYAFDTHTLTHTVPSLAFTNMHAHTSQLTYCPLDKKLYSWDDGHQMMYDVIFAY